MRRSCSFATSRRSHTSCTRPTSSVSAGRGCRSAGRRRRSREVLDLRHQVRDLSLGPMGRGAAEAAALRVVGCACAAAAADPALRGPAGRPAALAAPRPGGDAATTTTSRTASTSCCSARAWSTRARTSREPDDSLETAQERKLELICRKLRLQPGERMLDIGCGWGSLVLHAAKHHGVARSASRCRSRRRPRAAAHRGGGPCGPRRDPRARLPRARRAAVRQDRERRHVRARRPCAARHLRRRGASAAAAGRAVPQPRHHAHPHQAAARRRRSSTATSSRTASCIR